MTPRQLLISFLLTCFSDGDLRQWLQSSPRYERLVVRLPSDKASLAEVVHVAVELLYQHGLVDVVLLDDLATARPGRRADLELLGLGLGLAGGGPATTNDVVTPFVRRIVRDEVRALMRRQGEEAAISRLVEVTRQVSLSSALVREVHTLSAEWRQLAGDASTDLMSDGDVNAERSYLVRRVHTLNENVGHDAGDSDDGIAAMTPRMQAVASIYGDLHEAVRRNDATLALKRLLDIAHGFGNSRADTIRAGKLAAELERWYTENPAGRARDRAARAARSRILDGALALGTAIFRGVGHDGVGVPPEGSPSGIAPLLRVQRLCKTYPRGPRFFGLTEISLEVHAGEIVGLVGPNGSGKSTLLRILAGEQRPDTGTVTYPGFQDDAASHPPPDWQKIKRLVGYIPQRICRWEHTLAESMHYWTCLHGIYGDDNEFQVEFFLQRLGLSQFRSARWKELSGGYQMRAALALALVTRPRLLLLDEPLAHLDVLAQRQFLMDLRDLTGLPTLGMAVILSSQHIHEVELIADTMMCLSPHGAASYIGPYPVRQSERERVVVLRCDKGGVSVERALAPLGAIDTQYLGSDVVVRLPASVTMRDILGVLEAHDLRVERVHDISRSTMRVFLQ